MLFNVTALTREIAGGIARYGGSERRPHCSKYNSGREGDSCLTGFSSRKADISIYLLESFPERDELLAKLGKHRTGKGCLYIRTLGDVDLDALGQLVAGSFVEKKRIYG